MVSKENQIETLDWLEAENGALKEKIQKLKLKKHTLKNEVDVLKTEVMKQATLVKVIIMVLMFSRMISLQDYLCCTKCQL